MGNSSGMPPLVRWLPLSSYIMAGDLDRALGYLERNSVRVFRTENGTAMPVTKGAVPISTIRIAMSSSATTRIARE